MAGQIYWAGSYTAGVASRIVWAWVLTIPAAALISAVTYWIVARTVAP